MVEKEGTRMARQYFSWKFLKKDAPQKDKNVVQVLEGAEIRKKRGDKER
jgi:hypothetical protein